MQTLFVCCRHRFCSTSCLDRGLKTSKFSKMLLLHLTFRGYCKCIFLSFRSTSIPIHVYISASQNIAPVPDLLSIFSWNYKSLCSKTFNACFHSKVSIKMIKFFWINPQHFLQLQYCNHKHLIAVLKETWLENSSDETIPPNQIWLDLRMLKRVEIKFLFRPATLFLFERTVKVEVSKSFSTTALLSQFVSS